MYITQICIFFPNGGQDCCRSLVHAGAETGFCLGFGDKYFIAREARENFPALFLALHPKLTNKWGAIF